MFRYFLTALSILGTPLTAWAQSPHPLMSREDLYEIVFAEDIEALETLFSDAHTAMTRQEITPEDLRQLNTMLITSHPNVLEVTEKWVAAKPDSIYANVLYSFQLANSAFRIRGGGQARKTHPEALRYFNALNERAFDYAWKAYQLAPGYVPASDAVIRLNNVMGVLWDYEVAAIVTDTMEQTPNYGTLLRVAYMHLPQWGGKGISGVQRDCHTYANVIWELDGFTPEICTALLVHLLPFANDIRLRAAQDLKDVHLPAMQASLVWSIVTNEDDSRHLEVLEFLEREGHKWPSDIDLSQAYFEWKYSADANEFMFDIARQARSTAFAQLYFDPFNPDLLATVQMTSYVDPGPHLADEFQRKQRDLFARQVGGNPYQYGNWGNLGQSVLRENGIDAARPYFTNLMAYAIEKEKAAFQYVRILSSYSESLKRRLDRSAMSQAEFDDEIAKVECEAVRLIRLNELLCKADPTGQPASCDPFQPGSNRPETLIGDTVEWVGEIGANAGICGQERRANLERSTYSPVQTNIQQFLLDFREPQDK